MPKTAPPTAYGQKSGNPRGKGPKKGAPNAGRRPKSLVLHLKGLRGSAKVQKALAKAASDPESKGFATAWRVLSEYDDEKPAEKHTIVGPVVVSVKFSNE